jgi:hypothetical protein
MASPVSPAVSPPKQPGSSQVAELQRRLQACGMLVTSGTYDVVHDRIIVHSVCLTAPNTVTLQQLGSDLATVTGLAVQGFSVPLTRPFHHRTLGGVVEQLAHTALCIGVIDRQRRRCWWLLRQQQMCCTQRQRRSGGVTLLAAAAAAATAACSS